MKHDLKNIYKFFYVRNLGLAIEYFIFIVCLTVFIAAIVYILHININDVLKVIDDKTSNITIEINRSKKFLGYIVNNGIKVPIQMFILALIPIRFSYLVNVIFTSILLAILFGIILREDINKGLELIITTILYSSIEIFAFCLFASVLFKVNQIVRKKLKKSFQEPFVASIMFELKNIIKVYAFLFLPLIILAAFLEAFVADKIYQLF